MKSKLNIKLDPIVIGIILFCVLLIYQALLGYFYTVYGSISVFYKSGGSNVSSLSMYIATIIFMYLGVKEIIKKHISSLILGCVILLLLIMGVWTVISIVQYGLIRILAQSASPLVYFLYLGIFIAMGQDKWAIVLKAAKILGSLCLIGALIYSIFFATQYGGYIGNSPQIMLLGTGYWPFAIYILCSGKKSSLFEKLTHFFLIGSGVATSLIYASRSWTILFVLLALLYCNMLLRENRENVLMKFLGVLLIAITVILFLSRFITTNFSIYLDYFISRGFSDSRTWQFKELFSQYSFFDIFFGQGIFATYSTSAYGEYLYIDNNTVYMIFHYGIIPALLFLGILVWPSLKLIFGKRYSFQNKMLGYVLFLWILSINGLSVYNAVTLDLRNAFIVLLIARCLWAINEGKKGGFIGKMLYSEQPM